MHSLQSKYFMCATFKGEHFTSITSVISLHQIFIASTVFKPLYAGCRRSRRACLLYTGYGLVMTDECAVFFQLFGFLILRYINIRDFFMFKLDF